MSTAAPERRARVVFRDRAVIDVLDLALRFLVVHGRAYAKVALVSLLPALVLGLVVGKIVGWTLALIVVVPLVLAAEIPFTLLASRLVFEDHVRVRDVLYEAVQNLPRTFFVRLAAIALIALGTAFFLLPGIWLSVLFFFTTEMLLLERGSIGAALDRSRHVASGAVSDVLLGLLLLGLLPALAVLVADVAGRSLLVDLLQITPPAPLWSTGGSVFATVGLFAQAPYRATARFFLYLNVRTRVEGWDIQNQFAAIALAPADDVVTRGAERR